MERATLVTCPDCPQTYSSLRNLAQHRRVEHEGLRHACDACGQSFTRLYALNNHRQRAHRGDHLHRHRRHLPQKVPSLQPSPVRFRKVAAEPRTAGPSTSTTDHKGLQPSTSSAHNGFQPFYPSPKPNGHSKDALPKPTTPLLLPGSSSASSAGSAYACPSCPQRTGSAEAAMRHDARHGAGAGSSRCSLCSFGAVEAASVALHAALHFGGAGRVVGAAEPLPEPTHRPALHCRHCRREFGDSEELFSHQSLHQ